MNRVYIITYGCQMNERDSEAVAAMLRNKGYVIVDNEKDADIILLNTCSVRDLAEQKAIGKAGHLTKKKRRNPNFIVGIMGCMAQNRGADLLDSLPDLDLIVGTQKFHHVPDHLDNLINSLNAQGPLPSTIVDLDKETESQNTIRHHLPDKQQVSAFVSIMQGCNMNCAFCIVPTTRGQERSRPMEHIITEIEELSACGTKDVTLLGQIVTSYGRREFPFVNGKSPFVQLLEKVNDIPGIERIRFTSPHPRGFKQDLIEAYRYLPKLCEYVHLPAQSFSNPILQAMKRPYSRERYLQLIDDIRKTVSGVYLSTDIIVGFPNESEEDFEITRKTFEEIGFDMAYIFKYSPRSGTEAATRMIDNIPKEVKEERNQTLLSILERSSLRRNLSLVGTTQEVLIEGPARKGNRFVGKTRGFRKVFVTASERLVGEIVPVQIEEATHAALIGTVSLTKNIFEPMFTLS